MRRAAHLVAPILIVITMVTGPVATQSLMRLTAARDGRGAVEALPAPPAAEVATQSSSRRLTTAAAEFERTGSNFFAASSIAGATLRPIARIDVPLSADARHGFDPETARGRAPPSSR